MRRDGAGEDGVCGLEGASEAHAGPRSQFRMRGAQDGTGGVQVGKGSTVLQYPQAPVRTYAEADIGLFFRKGGVVPAVSVREEGDIGPENGLVHLFRCGREALGEEGAGGQDECSGFQVVLSQVFGDHAVYHAFVQVGLDHLVSHQIGSSQDAVTMLQQMQRADARNGRGQGAGKNHLGRQALADTPRDGGVLQAEDLGEDDGVVVLQKQAHLLYHLLPIAVQGAGQLDGAHLSGGLDAHFRQVEEADAHVHARFFQALGNEGGEEVVVAHNVHQQHLFPELGLWEKADVFQ